MRRTEFITNSEDFKKLTASQLMETDVRTFSFDATWEEMAEAMAKGGFGSVPIVNSDHKLLGIISEQDILYPLVEGKELSKITAGDIMTKNPVTITEDAKAGDIVNLLAKYHLIRVPVVRGDKLVGIVARRDMLFGYLRATAKPPRWL